MKRSFIVIFVVLVALVVGFYFFTRPHAPKSNISTTFPDYFPKEIISDPYLINLGILSDAFLLPDEVHRAQVSYGSHKKIEENEKTFLKYFSDNGFDVQTKDAEGQKFIFGKKGKSSLSVTLFKESPVKVAIIYIVNK